MVFSRCALFTFSAHGQLSFKGREHFFAKFYAQPPQFRKSQGTECVLGVCVASDLAVCISSHFLGVLYKNLSEQFRSRLFEAATVAPPHLGKFFQMVYKLGWNWYWQKEETGAVRLRNEAMSDKPSITSSKGLELGYVFRHSRQFDPNLSNSKSPQI